MGNMPLICWGNDFEPTLEKNGYTDKLHKKNTATATGCKRSVYRVNPKTFFLLTV